jgi:uncharacterized protein YdaU (DUF1376 family)
MAEFPALPLWTDAYLADTTDLSAEEHGVYLLLLMAAWRSPTCALPDDDERLARMARIGTKKWRKMRPTMARFFVVEDGQWTQKRLLKERDRVETSRSQKSKAARAKHAKNKDNGSAAAPAESVQKTCNPYPYPYPDSSVSYDTDKGASVTPLKVREPTSKQVAERMQAIFAEELGDVIRPGRLTENKIKSLCRRLKDDLGNDYEQWRWFCQKVRASPFLRGDVTDFRATLNWLITRRNFDKVMDGDYDQRADKPKPQASQPGNPALAAALKHRATAGGG